MNNEMDKELQALLDASADVEIEDYSKEVPDGTYPAIIYASVLRAAFAICQAALPTATSRVRPLPGR